MIIGAGAIGTAIARELSKTKASVLVLEGGRDVTSGATKGNSGLVHAGYDDKPGSVKAKYRWPGNQMFPQLDRELRFGFQMNGSLVVAKSEEDMRILDDLMERGRKNGVEQLRIISKEELREMEPHIHPDAMGALWAPTAGTVTPYEYAIALAENAADNGVESRLRRHVVGISLGKDGKGFEVAVKHWDDKAKFLQEKGQSRPLLVVGLAGLLSSLLMLISAQAAAVAGIVGLAAGLLLFRTKPIQTEAWEYSPSPGTTLRGVAVEETVRCDRIVNAAGLHSDKVAQMIGDFSFKVKPRMGEYILLHKDEGFKANHILFPTPHPVYGKGVLVQSTLWGNLILGPTARDLLIKNKETGEYEENPDVRDEKRENILGYILSKCRNLVPGFDAAKVIHSFAGVRAKNTTGDWIIGPSKVPGFFNAASIDSPGIAASPAIAADVARMLREDGGPSSRLSQPDPLFNPNRAPIIQPKDGFRGLKMSKFKDRWKNKDPKKNVVCKCERVTESEIVEALNRSLPLDGGTQLMRRRTRCGMGNCQADPENYNCEQRCAEIIACELGISVDDVGRRPWPASSLLKKQHVDDGDRQELVDLSNANNTFKLHGAAS